ncbi:unnamed protein product [Penicillium nalgiovense]|uniref:Uncharacterized protein n=1 Tax=Penicillium nalgiovense TaxID=60175 RepID=A0A1V6XVJ8_PENNA|nr:hypothetical protein PENNAL_c0053G10638 [Penicillium nalgiovense]CAG7963784.1 unnamed protein product [Penicillium nalgiovense]CAG8023505.1 unnamed protein product [Penicillium nalgiovense]CAG8024056.1 unnamed protein product [Penicillium nalgiovense]CAG8043360.1 unnamed protein product [Penicillium nalgiovense]
MSTTDIHSSDVVSTWEQAYYDAWRQFHGCIEEIPSRLIWDNPSPEDRQMMIEKLARLPIEIDNIRNLGQIMFEHVPGCETVRERPLAYFVTDFIRECNAMNYKIYMLIWKLLNRQNSERLAHSRLFRFLESVRDRVPAR